MVRETDEVAIGDVAGTVLAGLVALDCTYIDTPAEDGPDCLFVITRERARALAAELIAEADRLDAQPQQDEGSEA